MENKILSEISNTCENCRSRECCKEKECVLFRIEQIVIKQRKKKCLDRTLKENNQLKEVIDKAQEFIRNENYLNESEIDELSEILDSYR